MNQASGTPAAVGDGPAAGAGPASLAAGVSERLSILSGDRFCATCGFNLVGQSVVREPHYKMLMVRCPECGTPAALQEYPMLGRWANRWARVLAVALMAVMLGFTVAASFACWGVSIPAVDAMVQPTAERIGEEHVRWQRERSAAAASAASAKAAGAAAGGAAGSPVPAAPAASADPTASTVESDSAGATEQAAAGAAAAGQAPPDPAPADPAAGGATTTITVVGGAVVSTMTTSAAGTAAPADDQDWWRRYADASWVQSAEFPAAMGRAVSWTSGVDWSGLRWLVLAVPVAFIVGTHFSVLMLGTRRRRALLIIPVVLGLSTVWMLIQLTGQRNWGGSTSDLAMTRMGVPLHLVVYMFMGYAMGLGIWWGRPIARWLVALMLPPRLRGSLADLWLCDGKTPPSGAGAVGGGRVKLRGG